MGKEYTLKQLDKARPQFKKIWNEGNEINPMPEGVKLTVYCEGDNIESRGFLEDVTTSEMGLDALIAYSWILQSELDELVNRAPNTGGSLNESIQ